MFSTFKVPQVRAYKNVSCKLHRRYQAKRVPRVLCEACWRAYILMKDLKAELS